MHSKGFSILYWSYYRRIIIKKIVQIYIKIEQKSIYKMFYGYNVKKLQIINRICY